MDDVLNSSSFHGWQTPEEFLELVRAVGPIGLDPCTTSLNPTKAASWFTPDNDGLAVDWHQLRCLKGLAYMNPPYGRALAAWTAKAAREGKAGLDVIALVPARTDTAWFQEAAVHACDVLLWKGRLKFTDPRAPEGMMWHSKKEIFVPLAPAAFPSAVFYFGGHRRRQFRKVFEDKGLFLGDR